MDSYQVLLVSVLHVCHLVILHILWDDVSGGNTKPQYCFNSFISILCNMESFLRIFNPSNGKVPKNNKAHRIKRSKISRAECISFFFQLQRIPVWWRWYYYICPVSWTLYGLVASQFGDVKEELETHDTVEQFTRSYFGFRHDFLGYVALILVGFVVLFGFAFAFSIKSFNFQKR